MSVYAVTIDEEVVLFGDRSDAEEHGEVCEVEAWCDEENWCDEFEVAEDDPTMIDTLPPYFL